MRSMFFLLSACSSVAHATECQAADETTLLQGVRMGGSLVRKGMKATDAKRWDAQGLVESLQHVANHLDTMSTDEVNQALQAAAAALATFSPAIQDQVAILQNTISHAAAAVDTCHVEQGFQLRAALWEAAEAQAAETASCEAELATAIAEEARICSATSVEDVQSECACNEARVRREDKEELCASITMSYEFAYCEHNLQCSTFHDCHEAEIAVYNQLRDETDAEMAPIELEYIAAQQSTCIMDIIQSAMQSGIQIDSAAIAACSAVDTSPVVLVYQDLTAAPEPCPAATTGSPVCAHFGAAWELIAHQGVPGWFPSSATSTYNVNEGDSTASSFMNVGTLTPSDYSIDGKYHLRLVYDVVTELYSPGNDGPALNGGSQEFEWTQTSWITETSVTGYEPVSPANLAASPNAGSAFSGLAKSSSPGTVFDGSPTHRYWFQSVGSTRSFGGGIPAFKGGTAQLMSLYISRIAVSGVWLPASGFYRIQQKQGMKYVDAYESADDGHNAVTRTRQDNPSQWWYLQGVGALEDQVYTIQQVGTDAGASHGRYLDAHESARDDYRVVTRTDQDNDSQRWHFTMVATNTFTLNHGVNMRFLDAHVGTNDGQLVTRDEQGNDSQKWVLTPLSLEEQARARGFGTHRY